MEIGERLLELSGVGMIVELPYTVPDDENMIHMCSLRIVYHVKHVSGPDGYIY